MNMADLVSQFVLPFAVVVSAAATTTMAALAWKLYRTVTSHDRALFGEEAVNGHDGVIQAVNENTTRSEVNRRVLRAHDMVPPGPRGDYYQAASGPVAADGEDGDGPGGS
ncbi:hypothetical protein K745_gp30 [Haloarcula hispanica virus PH1]|uniref:Uncharacterized protein n=1 Tax=Haloarcula hispanica virus PH1 TaxID=1282967 RepID=M4JGG4_9VIRU|nr:hypothetical protein K745_gp30 [Haloarcula hispanica virus PH1]AGC65555.1 hypothetical protein HhPH1_gp30 [Haloarcula hispanica virus PH1]